MEIGKIKFKIIVTIFIIALLLPIIMIIIEEIKVSIAINNTKDILSNINAKEMQEEIIDRLKDSKINVNTSSIKTEIEAFQEADEDIIKACTYSSNNDSEKDFVYAFIIDEKEENVVAIPLFRIESDSNGYFKNIEYVSNWFYNINILEKINKLKEKPEQTQENSTQQQIQDLEKLLKRSAERMAVDENHSSGV